MLTFILYKFKVYEPINNKFFFIIIIKFQKIVRKNG